MKHLLLSVILFVGLISAQTFAQQTVVLQPGPSDGKDALLHGLYTMVNTNDGNDQQLPAVAWTFGGTPGTVRSALGFDLSFIPSGSVINSARLSLYSWDQSGGMGNHSSLSGSNACWLQRITSAWAESTVTWNNQPSTTTANEVALPASTSPTQNYLNIDVTSMVQDMINDPSAGYGMLLRLQTESYYRRVNFCSSDHINSALRPKLEITFTVPVVSITIQPDAATGKDALLHGLTGLADTNYGNDPQLPAVAWTFDGTAGVVRGILGFDLTSIPKGSQVLGAALSLYAWTQESGSMGTHSNLSGSNACWLQRVTANWDEGTVTWNNQPATTEVNEAALAEHDGALDYTDINVSAMVQDMVNDPANSFGFLLKLQNENYYRRMNFCSSDYQDANLHPKLVVTYRPLVSALKSAVSPVDLSATKYINDPATKIDDIKFAMFPNPASNRVTIDLSMVDDGNAVIDILNSTGQKIYSGQTTDKVIVLDISGYTKGSYFVKVTTSKNTLVKELIIK
jgi:hypothetical protein